MREPIMVLVLTVLFLAGCTEEGAPEADHSEHGKGQAVHQMQNVTFFEAVLDVQESFEGMFDAQDHSTVQLVPGLAGQPTTGIRSHDITPLIPRGIPVFVEATVESGEVLTWVGADDFGAIWTSGCEGCNAFNAGEVWSGAVVNTGQTFTLNAFYPGELVPGPMPYEISVRVRAAPDEIPTGIALEVDMPKIGSHILFEGDVTDIMVFDPEDQFLGLLPSSDAQMYIDENMSTGGYVFMPVGHGQFYSLRSGADLAEGETLQVKARILTQEIRTTGPHGVSQNTEMTFELERQPLQMGIAYFGGMSTNARVILTSPDGAVEVAVGHDGFQYPVGAFDQTRMGDDLLRPGTYTLVWEDNLNDGSIQVQEFFTLYKR